MFKKISIGTAAVLMLLAVLLTFQITYIALNNKYERLLGEEKSDSAQTAAAKLTGVDELFRSLYIGDINEKQLSDAIIRGYIEGTGDTYAQYMNSEEFAKFLNDLGGSLEGIGAVVVYNKEYKALEVVSVMPDSPALGAGVLVGDLIIEVDGVDVSVLGYYEAAARMQGGAGSTADFTIARGTDYGERIKMSVERGFITEQTVVYHMYNGGSNGIGIIKLLQFDKKTPEQFTAAVASLKAQGAASFIFDVRNNSGGELDSVVSILDFLLPEGPVIRITDADGNETAMDSAAGELDAPMAVLVNGNTASAAELFAAALRDYKKAFLVGTKTYGKGSMQTIVRLPDDSAIRVTCKMYSPPFSANYDGVGLAPDYIIEMPASAASQNLWLLPDSSDPQLLDAVKRLG